MSELAALWTNLLPKMGDDLKPSSKRAVDCTKVTNYLENMHPDLYSGQRGAVLLLDDAKLLVAQLQKTLRDLFSNNALVI